MQEIQRRRDEILHGSQQSEPGTTGQEAGQVQYLQAGDEGESTQALGPAGEEERQKLEGLNILDEPDAGHAAGYEEDIPMEDPQEQEATREPPHANGEAPTDNIPASMREESRALTRSELRLTLGENDQPALVDGAPETSTDHEDDVEEDSQMTFDLDKLPLSKIAQSDPEMLWRKYTASTADLSYTLCEQLRLVLEPTLATRLQGDFRTGKRLNMRKIIPYIASDYTKDKIWLRRTKPSKREYQVLISLDDSRSMAESHSIQLAYQTLALVSQAMNKLEVGQIAIARFGDAVDIIHEFADSFSEKEGPKVVGSFNFDQHRTDVAALLSRSLEYLSEAREHQQKSSTDLWQLQIIISDGVCQDHPKLRTLLRKANEERVMIVFLILDSLQPSSTSTSASRLPEPRQSILTMQTVAYKEVNGQMDLEMRRYLDSFPFEYFVVLRDVEALPTVLSDTLRQWMARVSQSQE